MQTDNLTDTDLHTFWTYKLQLGLSFLLIQNIQYICVSLKSESKCQAQPQRQFNWTELALIYFFQHRISCDTTTTYPASPPFGLVAK